VASHPLIIFGITGRMGQTLIRNLQENSAFHLHAAVASKHSSRLGKDAALEGGPSGVTVIAEFKEALIAGAVAVDFSVGDAVAGHAAACAAAGVPLLVGATGFDGAARSQLQQAAQKIPVLIAPNTSLGVAVLSRLVAEATVALGDYEIEIAEAHHRLKRDAPSGTALKLGEVIEAAGRAPSRISYTSVRAGDIVGEHTVSFTTGGERLELIHRATDRASFGRGALRAAAWLIGRPPGLYGMKDVLGF
jgi:4-hydroxy-tetrahydrodipicolinate reductase